jgi:phosphohistidine phosphatase SixA
MVIGHNPGMELFLDELTGIASRFPTGALAAIQLTLSDWSQFDKTTRGTLSSLWRPRELD